MANGNDNDNANDGVTKPFYKNMWFIILMALLALVLIFALAVFAYNQKMKSNWKATAHVMDSGAGYTSDMQAGGNVF